MVNRVVVEIRGTEGAGWYWVVRSEPPLGTVGGMFVLRTGYTTTLLAAWWKSRKAARSANTTLHRSDVP